MKKIIGILILICSYVYAFGQYDAIEPSVVKTAQQDRNLFYGGGFGLFLGSKTYVDLSPRLEYQILSRLSGGLGGSFIYYNDKINKFNTNIYGVSGFLSFAFVKDLREILPVKSKNSLLLHAELSWLNLGPEIDFWANPARTERFWLFQPQIGIGMRLPIGKVSYGSLFFLYNMNESLFSPYSNPVISFYLMF